MTLYSSTWQVLIKAKADSEETGEGKEGSFVHDVKAAFHVDWWWLMFLPGIAVIWKLRQTQVLPGCSSQHQAAHEPVHDWLHTSTHDLWILTSQSHLIGKGSFHNDYSGDSATSNCMKKLGLLSLNIPICSWCGSLVVPFSCWFDPSRGNHCFRFRDTPTYNCCL